jgi:hypothetical protein
MGYKIIDSMQMVMPNIPKGKWHDYKTMTELEPALSFLDTWLEKAGLQTKRLPKTLQEHHYRFQAWDLETANRVFTEQGSQQLLFPPQYVSSKMMKPVSSLLDNLRLLSMTIIPTQETVVLDIKHILGEYYILLGSSLMPDVAKWFFSKDTD